MPTYEDIRTIQDSIWIIQLIAVLITAFCYIELERKEIFKDYSFYMALVINYLFPPITLYILVYWIFVRLVKNREPHKAVWFWITLTVLAAIAIYLYIPYFTVFRASLTN